MIFLSVFHDDRRNRSPFWGKLSGAGTMWLQYGPAARFSHAVESSLALIVVGPEKK